MSEEAHELPQGVGRHIRKVVPSKRVKNAWRGSHTQLSLRQWVESQKGEIYELGQKWLANKRRPAPPSSGRKRKRR